MRCPHCLKEFTETAKASAIAKDPDGKWQIRWTKCTHKECQRVILDLVQTVDDSVHSVLRVHPLHERRPPVPDHVPPQIRSDYLEACRVLPFSEKASAALARRCLESLLREEAKVRPGKLFEEIGAVIRSGQLPSHLAEDLDAIREIGNLAAHPVKNERTGEIIEVEPHEAEWLLSVLEGLFDWYFVQAPRRQSLREKLGQKLAAAGRAPLKPPKR